MNPKVPWSTVGWVLVFPSVWLVYTLLRGSDIGWYPYFFLDEAQVGGVVGVVLYCALVLVIFVVADGGARRRQPTDCGEGRKVGEHDSLELLVVELLESKSPVAAAMTPTSTGSSDRAARRRSRRRPRESHRPR